MRDYNPETIKNHAPDYKVIADLLHEFAEKEISDLELEKRLENVNKSSLLHVIHFLDIERKRYEGELNRVNESNKLYRERHRFIY